MSINTIELPADLADMLRAAAAAEGQDFNNYAVARLKDLFVDTADPETVAALQEVIDDYNKGERGRPISEFMAELDAKYGPVPTSGAL